MNSITTEFELFKWLHTMALEAEPKVPIYVWLDIMHDVLVRELTEDDTGISKVELDVWIDIFHDLHRKDKSDKPTLLSRPLRGFLEGLAADLAFRGYDGEIEFAQLILMLIGELGLSKKFALYLGGSRARFKLKRRYEKEFGVTVNVKFFASDIKDSHFSLASLSVVYVE
jgi:hypothetical protein